ncbi:MAG: circularly permuted type 2 ATP-grasp protein [Pseudomonadota bacterium]
METIQIRCGTGVAASYPMPRPDRYDEAFLPDGSVRPAWQSMLRWLTEAGPDRVGASASELARLRSESGIAFAARSGAGRDEADTLPVILSSEEWTALAEGIAQRARLAEAVLQDLYGPARMVAESLVPAGLAYGGPSFAAHCVGWETPPARFTYVYEADIARNADGRWVVLSDRLDRPLGDGWLIANRIAASQALAEPFLASGIRRLASHYAEFQALLDSMTGWEGRLALLTGGEVDPRFFSHAYFARYLNAALIEPADLTVREGAAFVKTLDGLKKVDILLRGVPDLRVDALHRPNRAVAGAPALSVAARSGQLTLANAIGASSVSHRALAPFAHRLTERLLGESLMIEDAPCLWLGHPAAREQVLAAPDAWRIEPLTEGGSDPVGLRLGQTDAAQMTDVLERSGERYVAVATPPLSHTPTWSRSGLAPREWMMRVFACWTGEAWSLAPGGVAAVMEPGCAPPALGFGKDVWVTSDPSQPNPERPQSLLADRLADAHLRRTGRDLLSRVADEVFWLGRNAERAEGTLRILDVCLRRYLSGNRTDADPVVLADIIGAYATLNTDLPARERFRDAVRRLINDVLEPWGLPSILRALRSGAVRARMSISEESWRYVDRLSSDQRWRDGLDLRHAAEIARLIDDSLRILAALAGSAQENLTRNYAWRFLELGRRIERGYETALIARRLLGTVREGEETYLRAWLTLSDSTAAYRSRYMMVPKAAAVLDLLVLDESNPRALAFQLAQMEAVISQLPSDMPYRRPEHRRALALLTEMRLLDADQLAQADETGARPALQDLTERCLQDLSGISDLLARAFFAHSEVQEMLVGQARQEERR